ncbi:hypothetical protein Ahy_A01g004699 [Arachis hypogaea]|uniref:Uncharacterized protein n=1 Tax=Arachis hypogaea TaxID=3818 RepID=A0A445EWU5_ARAHY|nr:hypothetical protein Ahy_A01g004699 [Arachis hypogaea]
MQCSFGLGWITKSKPLIWCLVMYFVAMTGYSINLPLLRWKKFTIPTLLSTVPPMLIANNIAPFLHMKTYVLEKTTMFPRPRSIVFTIVVMSFYYLVIMLFKDIPDIEGDTAAGLQNLSIRLGPNRVFWLCVLLLEMGYGIAIIMGATSSFLWSKIFTRFLSLLSGGGFINMTFRVEVNKHVSIMSDDMEWYAEVYDIGGGSGLSSATLKAVSVVARPIHCVDSRDNIDVDLNLIWIMWPKSGRPTRASPLESMCRRLQLVGVLGFFFPPPSIGHSTIIKSFKQLSHP